MSSPRRLGTSPTFSSCIFSKHVLQFATFLNPKAYLLDCDGRDWPEVQTFFIDYVAATEMLAVVQLEMCWWITLGTTMTRGTRVALIRMTEAVRE